MNASVNRCFDAASQSLTPSEFVGGDQAVPDLLVLSSFLSDLP